MLHFIPPPQEKKKKKPQGEREAYEVEADVSQPLLAACVFLLQGCYFYNHDVMVM